jgi:O-antigen/teichoic acid export membrane protein
MNTRKFTPVDLYAEEKKGLPETASIFLSLLLAAVMIVVIFLHKGHRLAELWQSRDEIVAAVFALLMGTAFFRLGLVWEWKGALVAASLISLFVIANSYL